MVSAHKHVYNLSYELRKLNWILLISLPYQNSAQRVTGTLPVLPHNPGNIVHPRYDTTSTMVSASTSHLEHSGNENDNNIGQNATGGLSQSTDSSLLDW